MGNAKTAEWPYYFDQCLFIRRIKYCNGCMPSDKKVPVDKLHIRWIFKVLPKLDHLMRIFWAEFEPKNEQHVSSPNYLTTPDALICVNEDSGKMEKH
jgi:hypothetical protein